MEINGQILQNFFQEGILIFNIRTDNAIKNHFYSKLRKFIRKILNYLIINLEIYKESESVFLSETIIFDIFLIRFSIIISFLIVVNVSLKHHQVKWHELVNG